MGKDKTVNAYETIDLAPLWDTLEKARFLNLSKKSRLGKVGKILDALMSWVIIMPSQSLQNFLPL